MLKPALSCIFSLLMVFSVIGQFKKYYTLTDEKSFDTVYFTVQATSGISFIRNAKSGYPLNIFGNPNLDKIKPSFSAQSSSNAYKVYLQLEQFKDSDFGNGLAFAMLSSKTEEEENYWKFLLNDQKIYVLDFTYGIGSSDIDLSGTSIKKLNITTGSADVQLGYLKGEPNPIIMDTFMVKVDLGALIAHDLPLTRAENVIAEVGFGQAMLDFSMPSLTRCNVKASVGAGQMQILLPKDQPVIIHFQSSPLCGLTMAKGFEEVEKNIYVNMIYHSQAENLLTFKVDVTMGNVVFSYAE